MLEEDYREKVRDVQLAELEILKILRQICDKYEIKYSLHGGTLLGAVRHGGFIPWDDDLDVIMDREEYERFIDAWNIECPEGFYLQTKEKEETYDRNFLKIRREGTEFLQEHDDSEKMHTGVFIDVEPVDRIPGKMIRRLLFYYDCFRYELYSREYIPGGTVAMRFACKIMLLLTNHAGRMRKIKTLKQRITSYKEPDMQRVIIANFVTMGRPLPSDIMDTYSTMTFEGEEYMVIDGWEILLKTWYGDFMKLPPEESRKPGHLPISLLLE